jgi:hypothetical protein
MESILPAHAVLDHGRGNRASVVESEGRSESDGIGGDRRRQRRSTEAGYGEDGDATGGEWIKYQANYRLVG